MALASPHQDLLAALDTAVGIPARLQALLHALRLREPALARVAVALHEEATDTLRAAFHATLGDTPLPYYAAELEAVPTLADLRARPRPRVIQELSELPPRSHHTRALQSAGYRASYTLPVTWNGRFEGFVFFDFRQAGVLGEETLGLLDIAGRLAASVVLADLQATRTLQAAVRGATRLVHYRDPETGGHLHRMAHYSRLIAVELAQRGVPGLDEQAVEHIFAFAPMHDLGKLGIPDAVLFKNASLDPAEAAIMRRHPTLGRQMVDALLEEFGLAQLPDADLLRHIAEGHHEKLDGSGYPDGLKDGQVPLAARIVAVADVFDALTSHRPYKEPWPIDRAFAYLREEAQQHLDPACVDALAQHPDELLRIQERFRDA